MAKTKKRVSNVKTSDIIIRLPIPLEITERENTASHMKIMSEIPQPVSGFETGNETLGNFQTAAASLNQQSPEEKEVTIKGKKVPEYTCDKISLHKDFWSLNLFEKGQEYRHLTSIKTQIACYWCCHQFTENAVFMPIKLESGDKFKVRGIFCSFECCNSYMRDNYQYAKNAYLLKYMLYKCTGVPVYRNIMKKAPPREMLTLFGGHLSITEFRSTNKHYNILYSPMHYSNDIVEEITHKKIVNKTIDFSTIPTTLQPRQRTAQNLHNFIKITTS